MAEKGEVAAKREALQSKIERWEMGKLDREKWIVKYKGHISDNEKRLEDPTEDKDKLRERIRKGKQYIVDWKEAIVGLDEKIAQAREAMEKLDDQDAPDGEDLEHLYTNSMKGGFVEMQTTDSVLMGVAGSGKTSSLAMAMDEELPATRVSTPCAKAPVRTVTQTRIGVKENELSRMKDDEFFDTVVHTAVEVGRSLSDDPLSPSDSPSPPGSPAPLTPSSSPSVKRRRPSTPQYRLKLEEEFVRRVREKGHAGDLLYELRWNKLTDSGGQPQFLEMLPIFIHHISLGIFTIKLNETLDHHPMIEFYNKEGKPVGTPYESRYTNEHIVRYCMRALVSQASGKKNLRFLFIGTHRDLMDDSEGESLEDKNLRLRKIVRSFKMMEHVIYSNYSCMDLIFAINAKTPGPKDWEVMKHVRRAIVDSSNVPPTRVPIRWFAMELVLLRFVKDTRQAVLPEEACFKMMSQFHFSRMDFKAALKYLHQAKLIFYFESGLKGLVVADMQMILDKLSEVVRYNIELNTNPDQLAALSSMWMKFCRYGILNVKCLEEKFPDRYIDGVFSHKELLDLFIYLCIVSELKPGEFLMPCLLPVEGQACCNPELASQPVPALALDFPRGGPMLGTYCGLVCYLMSAKDWELAEDEDFLPCHISRNSVHFQVPGDFPGKITINDPLSSFFVVTFHGSQDVALKVCPLVLETILAGIQEVSKNLNYLPQDEATANVDANKPKVTFLCACGTTPLHRAIMSDDGDYLKCSCNSLYGDRVRWDHKVWYEGVLQCVSQPGKSVTPRSVVPTTTAFPELKPKTLLALTWKDEQRHSFYLRSKVSFKWRKFGMLLDLETDQLDGWNRQFMGDSGDCWDHVMQHWLEGGCEDYPASWEGLHDLLEDLQCQQIAAELEDALRAYRLARK